MSGEEPGLRVTDFDYELPEELIAQQPPAERGQSRMMLLDRATGAFEDSVFQELPALLDPGDLLVMNNSRVIPARLFARRTLRREKEKPTGRIEVMLTEPVAASGADASGENSLGENARGEEVSGENVSGENVSVANAWGEEVAGENAGGAPSKPRPLRLGWEGTNPSSGVSGGKTLRQGRNVWRALVRPGRKIAIGERLVFPAPSGEIVLEAEVLERGLYGERLLEFAPVEDFFGVLDRIGHIPLPHYIHRPDESGDRDRYQTVFAEEPGSVAAPTAGLHFTPEMLERLAARGVETATITLHVGLGTFAPLRVERVDEVRLHRERYSLSAQAAGALNRAVREGRRIVAVGTTSVRTLESVARRYAPGELQPHSGSTEIFISPGFEFRLVRALVTNFHLPQSSLMMLVSAFAGRERVLAAYRHAVEARYRFFSYGDCMLIR